MKYFLALAIAFAATTLSGCSKAPTAQSGGVFPATASAVVTNNQYTKLFTSDSGITYYVRRLGADEASHMPEDNVITGEKVSLLYIPIKNDSIVVAPLADRIALGYKIPPAMME